MRNEHPEIVLNNSLNISEKGSFQPLTLSSRGLYHPRITVSLFLGLESIKEE